MRKTIRSVYDCHILQFAIDQFECWCDESLLVPKPTKCACMRFWPAFKFQYRLRAGAINELTTTKDLGVIISNDFKFNQHIQHIINNANRRIGMIRRYICSRSMDVIQPLYKSFVRPILEYASIAWSPQYVTLINQLESVQHRCLRLARDYNPDNSSLLKPTKINN